MKMAPASARQDDILSGREATRDFLACFAFPAGLDASVDESSGTATLTCHGLGLVGLLISAQPSLRRPGRIHWLAYAFRDERLMAY